MTIPKGKRVLALQVAFAVLVTICLSVWQFNKGVDSLNQRGEFKTKLSQPPLDMHAWQHKDSTFRHIELRGRFDQTKMFLIENRRYGGESGYWVVGQYDTDYGRFLVNRGWASVGRNVQTFPHVETPTDSITIRGVLWPTQKPERRQRPIDSEVSWPIRLQTLDINLMAARTGAFAQEIRLIDSSPGVLQPAPLQMEFSTNVHFGYAFQWIVIGTLIVAGFWFFVLRRQDNEP